MSQMTRKHKIGYIKAKASTFSQAHIVSARIPTISPLPADCICFFIYRFRMLIRGWRDFKNINIQIQQNYSNLSKETPIVNRLHFRKISRFGGKKKNPYYHRMIIWNFWFADPVKSCRHRLTCKVTNPGLHLGHNTCHK
jgi:hypothetical protein